MKLKTFTTRIAALTNEGSHDAINEFMGSVNVKQVSVHTLAQTSNSYFFIFYEDAKESAEKKEKVGRGKAVKAYADRVSAQVASFTGEEKQLHDALKVWRQERVKETGFTEKDIMPNHLLEAIVIAHPVTSQALRVVQNMTKRKFNQFGTELMAICLKYKKQHHANY